MLCLWPCVRVVLPSCACRCMLRPLLLSCARVRTLDALLLALPTGCLGDVTVLASFFAAALAAALAALSAASASSSSAPSLDVEGASDLLTPPSPRERFAPRPRSLAPSLAASQLEAGDAEFLDAGAARGCASTAETVPRTTFLEAAAIALVSVVPLELLAAPSNELAVRRDCIPRFHDSTLGGLRPLALGFSSAAKSGRSVKHNRQCVRVSGCSSVHMLHAHILGRRRKKSVAWESLGRARGVKLSRVSPNERGLRVSFLHAFG